MARQSPCPFKAHLAGFLLFGHQTGDDRQGQPAGVIIVMAERTRRQALNGGEDTASLCDLNERHQRLIAWGMRKPSGR